MESKANEYSVPVLAVYRKNRYVVSEKASVCLPCETLI